MGNKVDCGRQREDEWDFYGLGQVEQVSPRPHATSYVTLTGPHHTLCFDLSYDALLYLSQPVTGTLLHLLHTFLVRRILII